MVNGLLALGHEFRVLTTITICWIIIAITVKLNSIAKTICSSRTHIKELCTELKAAREVVEAARVHHVVLYKRPIFEGIQGETYLPCECCICEGILVALKKYNEARRG